VLKEQKELAERIEAFRKQAAEAGPDARVADGDTITVGGLTVEVVHTPGHTLGSVCLYLREEKALFTGDTALGLGTVAISPPPHGDMALYLQSLERLKGYDCAVMLPGHGQAVHDVRRKLQELIGGRPITYPGQQFVNAAILVIAAASGVALVSGVQDEWGRSGRSRGEAF